MSFLQLRYCLLSSSLHMTFSAHCIIDGVVRRSSSWAGKMIGHRPLLSPTLQTQVFWLLSHKHKSSILGRICVMKVYLHTHLVHKVGIWIPHQRRLRKTSSQVLHVPIGTLKSSQPSPLNHQPQPQPPSHPCSLSHPQRYTPHPPCHSPSTTPPLTSPAAPLPG